MCIRVFHDAFTQIVTPEYIEKSTSIGRNVEKGNEKRKENVKVRQFLNFR